MPSIDSSIQLGEEKDGDCPGYCSDDPRGYCDGGGYCHWLKYE